MLCFILFAIACATYAHAQEGETMVTDNKVECINQMSQWCDNMQYPQQGAGLAVLSLTYDDPKGYYQVFCSSDSDGTNCTRNKTPWFTCNPDHILTYKGEVLTNASTDVDNDICKTADMAFNDLFVQNLSYDNMTLKNEVHNSVVSLFEQITEMKEEIEGFKKLLRRIPGVGDLLNDFNESLVQYSGTTTLIPGDNKQNSTEQLNQIGNE